MWKSPRMRHLLRVAQVHKVEKCQKWAVCKGLRHLDEVPHLRWCGVNAALRHLRHPLIGVAGGGGATRRGRGRTNVVAGTACSARAEATVTTIFIPRIFVHILACLPYNLFAISRSKMPRLCGKKCQKNRFVKPVLTVSKALLIKDMCISPCVWGNARVYKRGFLRPL
jgi:hypothetical protein